MKLPLEYNTLPELFDVVGSGSTTAANRSIEKILKKYKVKTVLDLSCGTGSQVFWLTKRGYDVTGADLSPALLKIAKQTARKEKIKIKLLEGDMRTIKVGKFDAVITIFNAVGHLTKSGLEKAMRNIHKNLHPNGIYVFDIFNVTSMTAKELSYFDRDMTRKIGKTKVHIFQYSRLDKKKNHFISYDHYELQTGTAKPKKFKVEFAMQVYTAKELREMLARNGFKVLGQYDINGSKFSDKKSTEILTVAQKI